jgi:hypothetical protein
MCLEKTIGRGLSYIDETFLDEVNRLMVKLKLEPNSLLIKKTLEKFKDAHFPVYLLFIELNEKLFKEVMKNTKWPYDITLMQLFILDPLSFLDKYELINQKKIQDICSELLCTPKNIFWNWSEKYDLVVKEVFDLVSLHPEGLTIEDICSKLNRQFAIRSKIQEVLSNNSLLLRYVFIIQQNGKYYPFFSNYLDTKNLVKAEEQIKNMASLKIELLKIEYNMAKYHVDVILKLLKGAKNLTSILKVFADKEIRFDDVRILKTLLNTKKTGLSKYMISRMKERFEALENDGLLQLIQDKYFVTDLTRELVSNDNTVLSLNYSDVLLFEEKIVKKGHEYLDIVGYLNFMLRLGLLKEVTQYSNRLFCLTSKGNDILRKGFDPRILLER